MHPDRAAKRTDCSDATDLSKHDCEASDQPDLGQANDARTFIDTGFTDDIRHHYRHRIVSSYVGKSFDSFLTIIFHYTHGIDIGAALRCALRMFYHGQLIANCRCYTGLAYTETDVTISLNKIFFFRRMQKDFGIHFSRLTGPKVHLANSNTVVRNRRDSDPNSYMIGIGDHLKRIEPNIVLMR